MAEYEKTLEHYKSVGRAIEAAEMDLQREKDLRRRQQEELVRLTTETDRAALEGNSRGLSEWKRRAKDMEREIAITDEEVARASDKIKALHKEYLSLEASLSKHSPEGA